MSAERSRRYLLFLVSIVVGVFLGSMYGWFIRPTPPKNVLASSLRSDYKADYVLMVAEVFKEDGNVTVARSRLVALDSDSPVRAVMDAIDVGRELHFPEADLEAMAVLAQALQTSSSVQGGDENE